MLLKLYFVSLTITLCQTISSPLTPLANYIYSTELEKNIADLWWTVNDTSKDIVFELHIKTTGWIALGISPAGGMTGADIAVGWVDSTGFAQLQDRYAAGSVKPMLDNTTNDWILLQGREQDGWTSIQFKRLIDTCDTMDVRIKSGTNILIYAYGLNDPVSGDITYHGTRRGSRIIPLQSYSLPPPEDKFENLDRFELQMNNFLVPSVDTTYHCQVFQLPNRFTTKHHAIAHEVIVDPENVDIVHHMDLYECEPDKTNFDGEPLPTGDCDAIVDSVRSCFSNLVAVWSIGADKISEYISVAGYPIGGNSSIKYFMLQMHYDNAQLFSNRRDNSGIRFFIDSQLRQHDLGYLSFGVVSNAYGLAIPPRVEQFSVDSYCTNSFSQNFPCEGIHVISSFPHTHLQGKSVWTKLIRDGEAIDYLFNAESFNFNYQFENRLRHPITLYPERFGDEFITRCDFNTENKNEMTLGGEKTKDEMCIHVFMYYPRIDTAFLCRTMNDQTAWQNFLTPPFNVSDSEMFKNYLHGLSWTTQRSREWQEFYNVSPRQQVIAGDGSFQQETIETVPVYQDLIEERCTNQ